MLSSRASYQTYSKQTKNEEVSQSTFQVKRFHSFTQWCCLMLAVNSYQWDHRPHLPDDDTLVLAVNHHIPVHVVSQCIDVGGILVLRLVNGWMRGWMNRGLGGRKG